MITEPDVALTDYGLAVESATFSYLLFRQKAPRPLKMWFAIFFGSVSLAALAGGTVHGFFLDVQTIGAQVLWPITLIAIGVSALAAWAIGAKLQFPGPLSRTISAVAAAAFAGYTATVLFVSQTFLIAIVNYLPAAVFLLIVFLLVYRRTRERSVLAGVVGLTLTFVASGVQQGGVGLHPVYFNHNATYHVIQAAALFMIFLCARRCVGTGPRK